MAIEVSAPVRICDNGGWTDTWFGGPGRILNVAVTPGVEVSIRTTAGPDPVVFDVETFGDRYSDRPQGAPGRTPPASRGRHRRVPTPEGSRRGSQCSFRRPGWLWHRYVSCSCGCSAGRIGCLAPGATLPARHRLRSAPARSRHPRCSERDPGPAERGIRWDQLPRDRDVPRGQGVPTAALEGTQLPVDAGLPWSRPRLLGRTPPGHRGCWTSRVRGVFAVARCGGRGSRGCPHPGSRAHSVVR